MIMVYHDVHVFGEKIRDINTCIQSHLCEADTYISQVRQEVAIRHMFHNQTHGVIKCAASQHAHNVSMTTNIFHQFYFLQKILPVTIFNVL